MPPNATTNETIELFKPMSDAGERVANKIIGGWLIGIFWCAVTGILLESYLVPILTSGTPRVPYGSATPIPLFYLGALGAAMGYVFELTSKQQRIRAATVSIIASILCLGINLTLWFRSGFPIFHYSNIMIFAPTIITSGLILIWGAVLFVRSLLQSKKSMD